MALPKLNTSKFLTTVPSTGQEVEYRPYLVKEEKVLMMALETKDQSQIVRAAAQVIKDCITENIDSDKSSGEIIDLKLPCEVESCKHVNTFSVDISKIEPPVVTDIEPIDLTPSIGVQMRWPGVRDLQGITNEDLVTVEGVTKLFQKLIVNIYEEDDMHDAADESEEDLTAFVESLNTQQFTKLTAFLNEVTTLEYNTGFCCAKCQHETKVELRGLQSFFT